MRFAPSGGRTAIGPAANFTEGIGLVASRDGSVQEIRPGDVVYSEPGEEHWHGATADRFMAHLALQQADDAGPVATWLDHVDEDEYEQAEQARSGGVRSSGAPLLRS